MAETISLEILLEADKADLTLGQLRDGMKNLEEELENTKRGTKRFDELSTAMAQTNREVKNLELSFEALDNEQVASEIGSVAGAIGDVTASFVLLGGENETMQEMAAGIEKAMAISMGFKGAIEGVSSGMKLYNNLAKQGKIQTVLFSAASKVAAGVQMLLNAVMSANPLGIIILAITGVIAAFVAFGGTIKKLIDFVLYPYTVVIDAVIDALQWLGIMESDAAIASKEAAEVMIKASEDRRKELDKLIAKQKEATDTVLMGIDFEINKRKAANEDTRKLERDKLQTLWKSAKIEREFQKEKQEALNNEIQARIRLGNVTQEQVEEYEKLIAESIKNVKESSDNFKKINNDLEVFIIEGRTKTALESEKIRKKEEADKKKEEADKKKAAEEASKRAEAKAKADFEKRKSQADIELVETRRIAEEEVKIEEEKKNGLLAGLLAIQQAEAAATEQKELNARLLKKIAIEEDERRQKQIDKAQVGLDVLNNGADAFIKDEAKREKVKKKLAIAQLAIDTARSISSGIAAAAGIPFPGNIIAFAPTIAAILGNIAQAKSLLGSAGSTSAGSLGSAGASSSGAGGGVPINPVSNTSTIVGDQQAVVEVVEINKFQKKVGVIEASATF